MGHARHRLTCGLCPWIFNDNHTGKDNEAAEVMWIQKVIHLHYFISLTVQHMIYTYEALKDHVTSFHPQLLNDFIQGWESIDFNTRLNWQAHGLSTPEKEEISDY